MRFAGRYLNTKTNEFNWTDFKQAIDDYPDADLTFDKFKNTTINQSVATVETMVQKIAKFLLDTMSAVISEKDLKETIEATFTDLKKKSDEGFGYYKSEGSNSSFTYRIIFSIPNQKIHTDFYSLVTTITLKADISDKSSWFGLNKSSSKNFSAEISALELVVTEGFKAPSRKWSGASISEVLLRRYSYPSALLCDEERPKMRRRNEALIDDV